MTRRRGATLEAAIVAAVEAELDAVGYADLTVAGVAERANTSKPVLYRRWPSRAHLVYAAIARRHRAVVAAPDTGSLRGDLVAWLTAVADLARAVRPATVWGLLADSADDPELLAAIRADLAGPAGADVFAEIAERAVARGELTPRPLTARQLALPVDLLRAEILLHGHADKATIESIVDEVLVPVLTAPHPPTAH